MMRELLSDLIVAAAAEDERFMMLSGDHGYALFDAIREKRPAQFLNVGVAEQCMIGVAAGLAKTGFRPCVYGLSAFVPIRVLEQIKLDLCHADLAVTLLGDGAGLVYSSLGVSHQCGEDIACLRTLPNISIYSPCDAVELAACWNEAQKAAHPCYIRLGKADMPSVHFAALENTTPTFTHQPSDRENTSVIVATGSMVSACTEFARRMGVACISVPRIQPFPEELLLALSTVSRVIVVEEHTGVGGLWSSLIENIARQQDNVRHPKAVESVALRPLFTSSAGTWQNALSEHGLSDEQLQCTLQEFCDKETLKLKIS